MLDARLSLALDGGGFAWPEAGKIAVFGPPADAALDALPKDRSDIIVTFKPDFDAFEARGFTCKVDPEGQYEAAAVCLPRSKIEARALIERALRATDGPVLIDGQKTDGIDSVLREVRKITDVAGPISKAHGKLFWITGADAPRFADWAAGPELTPGGFWTAPGVFSADGVDPASQLLVDALPEKLGGQVADLGAGWGYISAHILTREAVKQVHLVEAAHMAVECARRNVTDPRAHFHWADVPTWQAPLRFDTVVMNPPFHTSRVADPAIGQAFVSAAARMLAPQGQLWMVANRHLPYETKLSQVFTKVEEVGGDNRFKLFHAARPLRKRS